VLYECLTGEQAYSGETVSDVVARILEREPAWDALPARTPPGVRDLLRRCLTKDPSRRLRDIGEARIALENLGAAPSPPAPPPPPTRRRGLTAALPWVVALLAAATAVALAVLPRSAPPRSPLWLGFTLPPGEKVDAGREFQVLAAAPDGKSLAYVSLVGGNQHLMFRSLENPKPVVLPGTEEARDPFFSPDGEWVAFFAGRTLRKVSVRGGTPVNLAEVALDRGGTWTERGDLIYSPSYESGLWRLPAGGGEPRPFTVVDSTRGERTHRWPCALPGGEWIVFTVGAMNSPGGYDDARIEAVSLRTGEQRPIARGSFARFAPGNRLIVARSGSLYEVPLDPADPRGGATPTPVLDGVAGEVTSGAVFFDVARDGTLFWVQGSAGRNASRLAWVDFSGNQTVLPGDPLEARKVAVSPDGARALVEIGPGNGNSSDIWLLDLSTISYTRLTFGGLESEPLWMPDGRRFAWLHDGGKTQDIMIRSVDGADSARVVYRSSDLISLTDVTPDGRDFVFSEYGKVQSEVWRVGAEGGSPPEVVAGGARSQGGGKVSPDGHWIAYHSDETGTIEVYVRPYRRPGPQSQMTTGGGRGPLWAPDGRSLFYSAHGSIYRIDVSLLGEMVRAGNPRRLFAMEVNPDASYGDLDLDPSGTRFLARITAGDVDERREIGVVPDWAGGLPRN
jgi:Tol biopolymer transport system component